jgi:hypothetical protein
MPLVHPWIFLALIYALALMYSISRMAHFLSPQHPDGRVVHAVIFLLAIIGVGIFSYYQGRSHAKVFVAVVWPGLILLACLVDDYEIILARFKSQGRLLEAKTTAIKSTLIFMLILSYATTGLLMILFSPRLKNFKTYHHQSANAEIKTIVDFLDSNFGQSRNIVYIGENVSAIDSILGWRIIAPIPDPIDWFTKDDYNSVLKYMISTTKTLVFDDHCYALMSKYESERFNQVISTSFKAIPTSAGYHVFYPLRSS